MHARNRRVVKRVTVRSMIKDPPREMNMSCQWEVAALTFKGNYRWVMNTAWRWPLPSLSSVCDCRLYMLVLQQLSVRPQVWAGLTAGRPHGQTSHHCLPGGRQRRLVVWRSPAAGCRQHRDGLLPPSWGTARYLLLPALQGPTWRAPAVLPSTSLCVGPSWRQARPCSAN